MDIFEGGSAIGGQKINREDIPATLQWISTVTKLPIDVINKRLLGSVGKVQQSGDIDIAVTPHEHDQAKKYLNASKISFKEMPGIKVTSFGAPIAGDRKKGHVQVDLMIGEPETLSFGYHSPGEESKYKGVYRTSLLTVATKAKSQFIYGSSDDLIARIGYTLLLDKGLVWQMRMRPIRKDGKGRLSGFKSVSEEELLKDKEIRSQLPGIDWKPKPPITNPDQIASYIFPGAKAQDVTSFEKVKALVDKSKDRKFVWQLYKDRLAEMGLPMPGITK
jgi:hypothetical protein